MTKYNPFDDIDPLETNEWLESIDSVLTHHGPERAHFLLNRVIDFARRSGAYLPYSPNTAYVNTIAPGRQPEYPGDRTLERRIEAYIRWNAMAMVVRANRGGGNLGGHIATYQSVANLLEIGFNHFFRGPAAESGGDLVMIQGHSSPGVYSRAFLEGRLTEEQLAGFRREVDKKGLSSYPHPWLMPDFWRFPTVSMGLTSISAIYQARFMKYLHNRGVLNTEGRKVWACLGDGEMDEPESLGAISLGSREDLDNLIFVINCNLQRLDGPVRGNGKIIQELEAVFRGAGWNVIKVIWGSNWDPLLARDHSGLLRKRMEEVVDGQYQAYLGSDGGFIRQHFFGKYPETAELVADMSDEEIWRLKRGGHDPQKVYAAFAAAVQHAGQPTVVLAHTVKGYGMGESGEGQNITHQQKKMGLESLRQFRDRFNIPIAEESIDELPFYRPGEDSATLRYLRERRQALGGYIPSRKVEAEPLEVPELSTFSVVTEGSGDREVSTTMAFVRLLMALTRDKAIKEHIVPIVADEARTFGMEGMFRQVGIYAPSGQLYTPEDADQLAYYREEKHGQILQEGITEAGSLASWIAAGTSHANHGIHMVPFFIFYSMFGFQRVGDLIWQAGDMQAKGFLMGATSGRTTLNGEGLQHQDGHSHLISSAVPNCRSYDPAFGYELAVLVWDGLKRMYAEGENIFYYLTLLNENYRHPAMTEGIEEGICRGMYLLSEGSGEEKDAPRVQLLGSGSILREVLEAAELLQQDFGVAADVWSVTSFNELRRDGMRVERTNRLHPKATAERSYVEDSLQGRTGPVIASTDYVRSVAEQIRPFVPGRYVTLGTDGYGRSDTREQLRRFFEIDRHHVVIAALKALADDGVIAPDKVEEAIQKYEVDSEAPPPWTV